MSSRGTDQESPPTIGLDRSSSAARDRWLEEALCACGPALVIRAARAPLPSGIFRWLHARGAVDYHSVAAVGAATLETLGPGGFVLLHVDPFDLPPVLDDVRALRRAGHVGAIIALVESIGIRATTSLELQRAGVDEVLLTDMRAGEFASRVELATQYAVLRPDRASTRPVLFWTQPVENSGTLRLLSASEMREILLARLRRPAYSDFVFAVLRLGNADAETCWRTLRGRMRILEGDLVARLGDAVLGLLFEAVPRASGGDVVARVLGLHAGAGSVDRVTIYRAPEDRLALLEWVLRSGPADPA